MNNSNICSHYADDRLPLFSNPTCPSVSLMMSVHLNGNSVHGQVDADTVSHIAATRYGIHLTSSRAMIQTEYLGTSFAADVPVNIGDLDCEVAVGHE